MAAICGTLGGGAKALPALLVALADCGAEQCAWTDRQLGLGCRSAKTTQDAAAALCVDEAAGLALVVDARLDDRGGLCNALGVPAADRAAIADAKLIGLAWRRWGRDCPRHLLGDYAFALWDERRRVLFCARDHIGARPFYYAAPKHGFVFAGTVEAVLAAPGVPHALDEQAVAAHLGNRSCSDAHTFFAAVRKLPPGHSLAVERPPGCETAAVRMCIERHWRPELTPLAPPASDDACAEQLLELYEQAVRDRLRGYGPQEVGAHLSGGLDSSSVAVLLARQLRNWGRPPPPVFTWLPALGDAPPKPEHAPEYALVDAVGRQEGLRPCHGALSPRDLLDVLRLDGALPGVHVHLNEEIAQRHAADAGVRLLLSGWGGDECVSFHGRGHWQHLLLHGRWGRLAAECRAQESSASRFLAHVALPLLHPKLPVALHRLRRGRRLRKRMLIDPAFARRTRSLPERQFRAVGVRSAQLRVLRAKHLSVRIEGWAASGARRGIEYAYPLLDRRLLEFALGLPPEQFRRGSWGRWLFRRSLRTVLPPAVCWNVNKTDPARSEPLIDAFVEQFPRIREMLAARTPSRAGYVDMPRLLERLDAARFRAQPEPGPIMKALQFLDF